MEKRENRFADMETEKRSSDVRNNEVSPSRVRHARAA